MPHGKGGQQSTRKNPREESSREDDFELEIDPTAREDTLSPLYSASTAGSASSGSSVSSSQLEMILAANSKILADSIASNQRSMADSMASNQRSMEASQKSMESSFLSALSTLSTSGSVAPSVASAPPPAVAPSPAVKVPKWTDGDQPFPFFTKLETAFTHNKVDKATWGRLLPVYLSGRAEIAFAQVDSSLLGDYEAVKGVLLKALGDTPAHAERHWWSLARQPGETPADLFSRVRHTGLRRLSQLPTKEAVVDHVILSRFLSLLPVDSYAAVMAQHPKTGLEAAEFLMDFEETRAYSRKWQTWKDHQNHHRREPHRSNSPNNSSGGNSSSGTGGGNTSSESGVMEVTGGNPSAGTSASGGSRHSGRSDMGGRKPVICHNCGEPGHIRPNCPNRIKSVRSPGSAPVIEVTGLIAGCFSDTLFEPEVACEAPPVVLEDIFGFDDSLFEPVDACDAPTVVMDDIFSLSVFPFGPDLSGFEFPLPELDDDVLEASVAPACSDTFVGPRQLTEVKDEVLEVLEASVAPVCCTNIVVPRHLEEVKDEVLEAGVASVDSDKIVVPMQQVVVKVDLAVDWVAPADAVSDAASDTVCDNFNLPEEFFVEDQADVVASGPVDCKPMVGLDVSDIVDSLSETDPVLAPVPVARPEPEKVVIVVILAMEDSIPPKLCWQSPTVLVDHCLRFICCYTKATGKFAPGSCTVILMFDVFILVISAVCSFCSCISVCLSKLLVVLFFGAFGPRTVLLLHGLDDPPWRMPGAPCVSRVPDLLGCALLPMRASLLSLLLRPSVNRKEGEMLWSLPP